MLFAKCRTALAAVPVLLDAYAEGPPARKTGATGDETCTACHTGTANPSGGKVEVVFPGALTYTPGVKQKLTVTVRDSPARTANGFQLTARLASNERNGQAGTFTTLDAATQVICENDSPRPAAAQAPRPAIRAAQPLLQAFSGAAGLSAGTWVEIYGTNLSAPTREWTGGDFTGNQAPTRLDGVGVSINGKPAFVHHISPPQLSVQAPDNDSVGPIAVEVTGPNGTSDPVTVQKTKVSPALLTTPLFNVGGVQYVAAQHPDFQTFVGRTGFIAGVSFRPAMPGDTMILFAVGCGTTTPASPAGQYFNEARPLALPYQVKLGETIAPAQGFLAAGAVGLCQFNVTVPNLADGDTRIDVSIDGAPTGQRLFATIGH